MKNKNINKYNKDLISVQRQLYKGDVLCVPNEKFSKKDKRSKKWKKQRKKYGFCDTETWSLDYTARVWFYSHIKMLLDKGGRVVNYNIEVSPTKREAEALVKLGLDSKDFRTDRDIFEFILALLRSGDELIENGKEEEGRLQIQKAFQLIAVFMPRMWW